MGNTQSAQPIHSQKRPRRSNRLSKAPADYADNQFKTTWDQELFVESPPLSPYSAYSAYSPHSPHSPHSPWLDSQPAHSPELRWPINEILAAEPSSPASLRPSHASGNQSACDDRRTRSNFGEIIGEFKRRMSRSGSRTRDAPFSLTPELDIIDARFSQQFPAGGGNIQMPEPDRSFGLGVSTRDGFPTTETHRFPSIRRLSLYNPGKATRSPKNLLQTIFSPRSTEQDGRSFSYRCRDGHVPMRRTSADTFFLYEMTRSSPLRASTPSDLEYSHLGRLKLGSLRVVNGSASPAPSDRVTGSVRRQSFSDMKSVRLDRRSSSDLLRSRSRDWVDSYSATNLPQAEYAQSSHLEPSPSRLRAPRIDRSKSPLRSEYGGLLETPSTVKQDAGLPVFRLSWPKSPETFLDIPAGSIEDQPFDLDTPPITAPNEHSQALRKFSNTDEFNDDPFVAEDVELVLAGKDEVVECKDHDEMNRGRSVGGSAGNGSVAVRGQKTYPLTKADSGYSSASSNRSIRDHKLALTKRGGIEDEETTGQPSTVFSGANNAIEECNEASTSRPTSRRRSLSETPPPVPRKDTPPLLKTRNLHEFHSKTEELPLVQANASFSQRVCHIRPLSLDTPKRTPVSTPILSPTPVDGAFRSFLTDNTLATEQNSWLWSPDPSQRSPLEILEANYSCPIHVQANENTTSIHRSTSVQTKKSNNLAHFSHPHPLQAHRIHRPQSMVNLNKEDCAADLEPDLCHLQQYQEQKQIREESQGGVRGSFFRHRSRIEKRKTAPGDRTNFFIHRRTESKPINAPTRVLENDAAPTITTKSMCHNGTPPNPRLDRDLPPIPSTEHKPGSLMLDHTTSSRWDSSGDTSSDSNNRSSNYNNDNDNNEREHNQPPSTFTGPFPVQNPRMFVKPKRNFVPRVEGRRDPFFCVGFPQSQRQSGVE
ncbi:hypothetical protein AJ78_06631 [Emergomyces pasteurianus Ep9510]|uniref:Uncharacterized protein n=1 Tax=Emergomyces pasteurianus Ep9510 TaxID=1447872 RepID=A0A1J9QCE2_9EURO|nr:hypothetical protein AJ78_06631 [Emergomyces pasteurianus Ep9510]